MEMNSEDLLLYNGRIWPAPPYGTGAEAVFIRRGRVAALGESATLRAAAGNCHAVDLAGAFVLPGFIDAHCHLLTHGESRLRWVDLRGATSLGEIQERLRARLAARPLAPGEWLLGRGFDQDLLAEARMPATPDLDAVSHTLPIAIARACSHALVANTPAQALAGVHSPTGFFAEGDMQPIWNAVPPPSQDEKLEAAALACREAAAAGFTGAHCITHAGEVAIWRELHRRGHLPLSLRLLARSLAELDPPGTDEAIPCRTLKLFVDGSLGARTAALSQPYTDQPDTSGRICIAPAELEAKVMEAHRAGYQLAIHAIGDAAVDAALDALAAAQRDHPRANARHRIEHASVLAPRQVDRFPILGVIAVVQPQFAVSDFWIEDRLGPDRAAWAYPFRSLLQRGAALAGGTDCPIEVLNPFHAVACATGRTPKEQRITAARAIALFTRGAAFAGFQENERGALLPGFHADLVVVPEDPRHLPPDAIAQLRPVLTLVGGRVAYANGRFAGLPIPAAGESFA